MPRPQHELSAMDSRHLTKDLALPYVDVALRRDGTWAEIPRQYHVTRRYPEKWAVLLEDQNRTASLVLNEDHTYELTPREQPQLLGKPEQWVVGYRNFYDPANLGRVRAVLEKAPLIVEHRILMGGSAPNRLVFDGYDDLVKYIHEKTKPGDALLCWDYGALCRDDNMGADGRLPDEQGRGFKNGAY
jgi:hypothetical protein